MRPAHPRSRGENATPASEETDNAGSSPLTRGKRIPGTPWRIRRRLIPAHAGKTSRRSAVPRACRAHPRSRGENTVIADRLAGKHGSSPLTRGKPPGCRLRPGADRLIPAHAGKTSRSRRAGRSWKAHPRSRGENTSRSSTGKRPRGSSPLTRGKHPSTLSCSWSCRLIPAHAGKTTDGSGATIYGAAHPRSRGENVREAGETLVGRGSSPLTRGKRRTAIRGP